MAGFTNFFPDDTPEAVAGQRYSPGDLVFYNDNVYACTTAATLSDPIVEGDFTTNFALLSGGDGGVADTVDDLNSVDNLSFWSGTRAQYDALTPDETTIYYITDDEAEATGFTIQDNGAQEGIGITTLNFNDNLDVEINGSIATINGQAGGGGAGISITSVTFTDADFMELAGVTHGTPGAVNYIEILGSGFTDFSLGGDTNTVEVQIEDESGVFHDIAYTRSGSTLLRATIPGNTITLGPHATLRVINGLGQQADFDLAFQAGPSLTLRAGHVLMAAPGEMISFVVEAATTAAELPITLTAAPAIQGTDLGLTVTVDETADTWTVTGTLAADAAAGSTVYTFTATDADGDSDTRDVTVTVGSSLFGTDLGTSLRFSDRSHSGLWYRPTQGGAANRHTLTFSIWFQRLGNNVRGGNESQRLVNQNETAAHISGLQILTNGRLQYFADDSTTIIHMQTTQTLNDFGSWYHVVVQQPGQGIQPRIWINGDEVMDWAVNTVNSSNTQSAFFTTSYPMVIGSLSLATTSNGGMSGNTGSTNRKFVGNMAQFVACSGLAHDADAFGEFSDEGYWQPIDISGNTSFVGNDGFILNFDDPDNPFNDSSVNGNHFSAAPDGTGVTDAIRLSAADLNRTAYNDTYAIMDTRDAGTTNPVQDDSSEVNASGTVTSSMAFSSGKYYVEAVVGTSDDLFTYLGYGEGRSQTFTTSQSGNGSYSAAMYVGVGSGISGSLYSDGTVGNSLSGVGWSATAPGGTMQGTSEFRDNDIVGMAIDADNETIQWFRFDETNLTTIATSSSIFDISSDSTTSPSWRKPWNIIWNSGGTAAQNSGAINFGQYDATNYNARLAAVNTATSQTFTSLSTGNLPEPAVIPSEHSSFISYTGNGGSNNIEFSCDVDFAFFKRSSSGNNQSWAVYDTARRAAGNADAGELFFNNNFAAGDYTAGSTPNVNGTNTVNIPISSLTLNNNGTPYIAAGFRAGGTPSANTLGSVSTMVSANTDAGFSIVTYSGVNGSGGTSTHGHGLSQAPDVIITKSINNTSSWLVYHKDLTNASYYLRLNEIDGEISASTVWGSEDPTDSLFTTGFSTGSGRTGYDYVAYCWHSVPGYSSFGSYIGNRDGDGPMVYTGFKPACVIIKSISGTSGGGNWYMYHSQLGSNTYNPVEEWIRLTATGQHSGSDYSLDFYSNGFKLIDNHADYSTSGARYLYMAWAEEPGKYSLGR